MTKKAISFVTTLAMLLAAGIYFVPSLIAYAAPSGTPLTYSRIVDVPFIANKVNMFRNGNTGGKMVLINPADPEEIEKRSLKYIAPNGQFTGEYVFTINSYQTTTEWISFQESDFNFSGSVADRGTYASVLIKVGNGKDASGEANGTYSEAIPIQSQSANLFEVGKTPPTGQYATITFRITSKVAESINLKNLIVNAKAKQILCPAAKKPTAIPKDLVYENVSSCFGTHGSKTVLNNLVFGVTFKGEDIDNGIHRAMIPDLLRAENRILEYEGRSKKLNFQVHADTAGYRNTEIVVMGRRTGKWSAHAWGLAFDLNAGANPPHSRTCPVSQGAQGCPRDIPDYVAFALEADNFGWGARFSTYCDTQHFQYGDIW